MCAKAWSPFKQVIEKQLESYPYEYFSAPDVTSYYLVPNISCQVLLPAIEDVTIGIGQSTLVVKREALLEEFETDYYGQARPHCRVMVEPSLNENVTVLGTAFLEYYNVTLDIASKTLTLYGDITTEQAKPFPIWAIVLLSVVGGVIVIVGIALKIGQCIRDRRRNKAVVETRNLLVGNRGLSLFDSRAGINKDNSDRSIVDNE